MSRRKIKRKPHVKRVRGVYAKREISPLDVRKRRKNNLKVNELRKKNHEAQQKIRERMRDWGLGSITPDSMSDTFSLDIEEQEDDEG